MSMKTGPEGLTLIKRWEGCEKMRHDGTLQAYDDGEGVATIGWGSTKGVHMGMTCTMADAEAMLARELEATEQAVSLAVKVPLSQTQFDALVSFAYNVGNGWLGVGGHRQATFIARLNAGDYNAVPKGLLLFSRGANSGKPYPGLLARRKSEGQLWSRREAATQAPIPIPARATTPRAVREAVPAISGSRKIWLASAWQWILGALGITAGGGLQAEHLVATRAYADQIGIPVVLRFVEAHGWPFAFGFVGLGLVAFELQKQLHVIDYLEGRWTPSGEQP